MEEEKFIQCKICGKWLWEYYFAAHLFKRNKRKEFLEKTFLLVKLKDINSKHRAWMIEKLKEQGRKNINDETIIGEFITRGQYWRRVQAIQDMHSMMFYSIVGVKPITVKK